jgi:integrase
MHRQQQLPTLVRHVTAAYREHAKIRYSQRPKETNRLGNLCTLLERKYGDLPAAEFGSLKLEALRNHFIEQGWTRNYINRMVRETRRVFRYAASRELIDAQVTTRLEMLEPLEEGFCQAPEGRETQPVDLDHVRLTAVLLSPVIKAMIELQAATGMRPSEVCNLKPSEVQKRPDGVWIYKPTRHKNSRRKKSRAIPIVGDVRITLGPYLNRDPDAFCFSPRESMAWFRQQQRKVRKSKVQPSHQNRKRRSPKKQPGEKYASTSYYRAIRDAAKRADIPHWYPYQLRHTAATVVREALGIEAAAALLGHARTDMTEVYAKIALEKAVQAAKAAPNVVTS